MAGAADHLPDDTAALKAALIETRAKLVGAETMIEHLQLVTGKMKREMFGPRSERSQRLIEQLELQLEELAAAVGEDEAKAQSARIQVQGFTQRPATRRNFPADLPRRRVVHPAPTSCPCCGSTKLSKIGEDITETLDVGPRQWFVTEHVREKFSCRSCDQSAARPLPCNRTRLCRAEPVGDDPGRQIRQSSATQSPKRSVCTRGDRALGLDHGGSCRRLRGYADAAVCADQGARVCRRAQD